MKRTLTLMLLLWTGAAWPVGIAVTPSNPVVTNGDTVKFTLTLDFSDDPTLGGSLDIVWGEFLNLVEWAPINVGDPVSFDAGVISAGLIDGYAFGDFAGIAGPTKIGTITFVVEDTGEASLALDIDTQFISATSGLPQSVDLGNAIVEGVPGFVVFEPNDIVVGNDIPLAGTIIDVSGFASTSAGGLLLPSLPYTRFLAPPSAVTTDNLDAAADEAIVFGAPNRFTDDGFVFISEGSVLDGGEALGSLAQGGFSTTIMHPDHTRLASILPFVGGGQGVYWHIMHPGTTRLVVRDGQVSSAPSLTAGTQYLSFVKVLGALNQSPPNNDLVVLGTVDDAAIPSAEDPVIAQWSVDDSGNLLSETILVKESDAMPGGVLALDFGDFGIVNTNTGEPFPIAYVTRTTGPSGADTQIVFQQADGSRSQLARESSASPDGLGRIWLDMADAQVSVNRSGSYSFAGSSANGLRGGADDRDLIVLDGAVLARTGDPLAAIAPFTLTALGRPILDDNGVVLAFASWDDPDTSRDSGILRFLPGGGAELAVHEGVTLIDGSVVDEVFVEETSYAMSLDGRLIAFRATLEDARSGQFVRSPEGSTYHYVGAFDLCISACNSFAALGGPGGAVNGVPTLVTGDIEIQETPNAAFSSAAIVDLAIDFFNSGEGLIEYDGSNDTVANPLPLTPALATVTGSGTMDSNGNIADGGITMTFTETALGNNGGLVLLDLASGEGRGCLFGDCNAVTFFTMQGYLTRAVDSDGDGVGDSADNCTEVANANQRDSDGDGFGNVCDGDLNNDLIVNPIDLGLLKSEFFMMGDLDSDFNGDGAVNAIDLGIFKTLFFAPPGPSGQLNLGDTLLAVAYIDVDANDGDTFVLGTDSYIAALIDSNGNTTPDSGDTLRTNVYPDSFAATSAGGLLAPPRTVAGVNFFNAAGAAVTDEIGNTYTFIPPGAGGECYIEQRMAAEPAELAIIDWHTNEEGFPCPGGLPLDIIRTKINAPSIATGQTDLQQPAGFDNGYLNVRINPD